MKHNEKMENLKERSDTVEEKLTTHIKAMQKKSLLILCGLKIDLTDI